MSHPIRVASVVLLTLALSGCTTGPRVAVTPLESGIVLSSEGGSDVGNNRPQVTYDGLMVRRRVVVAIHPTPDADLSSLRRELDNAATRLHTTLSDISPDVLDPVFLEHMVPELIVSLPAGGTEADAGTLVNLAFYDGRTVPGVDHYHVAEVLVHDLRFAVTSADPAVLAESIAREGILSDALGTYETAPASGGLAITYTGPLLSDELIQTVRDGISRRASTPPTAVTVSPRSSTGVGVDMAKEPAPEPAVIEESADHDHSAG